MKNIARKSGHFIARAALSFLALMLVFLAILQIGLITTINLFNAGKAHDFIQSHVTLALAASGYDAKFDTLYYDPVRGFTLYNLSLLDKEGEFATMDRFSLSIAFSKIPLRILDLSASAGEFNFFRLPASEPKNEVPEENNSLSPFTTPDIYFRSISISYLNIQKLNIGETITGTPVTLSPSLQARLDLARPITLDALLLPKAEKDFQGIALPEKISIKASLIPEKLSFSLNDFSVVSDDYSIDGKGSGAITKDGAIDFTINAAYPDLKDLTAQALESANISIGVNGAYPAPSLQINGKLVPASLKEKGLEDIVLSISAENIIESLKGQIGIKTSYLEKPVSIDAVLSYAEPVLTLESLSGSAPAIELTGSGNLSTQNMIFDGALSLTASDFAQYKDLLSKDIAGSLKADVAFKPVNENQSADITASAGKVRFDAISVSKANARIFLANLQHPWPQAADINLSQVKLSETVSLDKASIVIKENGENAYKLSLYGNGNIPAAISFKGGADLSNLTQSLPIADNINLTANLNKSALTLSGKFDPEMIDLKVTTKNFRGSDIPASLPESLSDLRLNGDVTMTGAPSAPVTKALITATGIGTSNYKGLIITADAMHENNNANVSISGKGPGINALKITTALPVTFSLLPFTFALDQNSALSGDALADLNLKTIAGLFLPPTQDFSGNLKANGTLGGTVAAPDLNGKLSLQNASFTDEQNGILFSAIKADAAFTKEKITISSLTATDGENGLMNGNGTIGFADTANTDFSLTMNKFHLPRSDLADGFLDASLSFKKISGGYTLGGTLDIEQMNIIVPETFQSKIPELNIVERKKNQAGTSPTQILDLGIKVNAPNQIFVRGWGLDAEFGGNLEITGNAGAPQINGDLSSKRGSYEEFGKRFTLERADLRFQGEVPPSPYLDIEATTPADDITASVLLTGPVKSPSIDFSSTPALPKDEVLSRILFGSDTAKITPFQAIQLAQTLRRFSGQGGSAGLDPLGMIRSATGLDDISVDTDANGETSVGVGKYLTDKVYLEFEKGKGADSGAANIQIEVTPNVNIQSEIGQDAQTGGGVFWKHDY